jgi:glycosyltransferase XagB
MKRKKPLKSSDIFMTGKQTSVFTPLQNLALDPFAVKMIPEEFARKYLTVPLWINEGTFFAASAYPDRRQVKQKVSEITRYPTTIIPTSYLETQFTLERAYQATKLEKPILPLKDVFIYLGFISTDYLSTLSLDGNASDLDLAKACLGKKLVDEETLAEAVGLSVGLPHISGQNIPISLPLANLIPRDIALLHHLVPLSWNGMLTIGVSCLADIQIIQEAVNKVEIPHFLIVGPPNAMERAFRQVYLRGKNAEEDSIENEILEHLTGGGDLLATNLLSAKQLSFQKKLPIEMVLFDHGYVSWTKWYTTKARIFKIPYEINDPDVVSEDTPFENANGILPMEVSKKFKCVIVGIHGEQVVIGYQNYSKPLHQMIDAIVGSETEPHLIDPKQYEAYFAKSYGKTDYLEKNYRITNLITQIEAMGILQKTQIKDPKLKPGLNYHDLGERLFYLGYVNHHDWAEIGAIHSQIPHILMDHTPLDEEITRLIPSVCARQKEVLPLFQNEKWLWAAVSDPYDSSGLIQLQEVYSRKVIPVVVPRNTLLGAIDRLYPQKPRTISENQTKLIAKLVNDGLLNQVQAAEAISRLSESDTPFDVVITNVTEKNAQLIATKLAEYTDVPYYLPTLVTEFSTTINPLGQELIREKIVEPIDISTARNISLEIAEKFCALPFRNDGNTTDVCFADPFFTPALNDLEGLLGTRIQPYIAPRQELRDAIKRVLGRKNIGSFLLLSGIINRSQLSDALDYSQRSGVRLGKALITRNYITQSQLSKVLAEQAGLIFMDLEGFEFDPAVIELIDSGKARELGILPLKVEDNDLQLAVTDPFNDEAINEAGNLTGKHIVPVVVTEQGMEDTLERLFQNKYLAKSVSELLERTPIDSAYAILTKGQTTAIIIFIITSLLWLVLDYTSYVVLLNALSTFFYLGFSAYKFYLVSKAVGNDLVVPISDEEVAAVTDKELPTYSILVPIYKETEVLPTLIESLNNLDYPKTKLDIKILMEADDVQTIEVFKSMNTLPHFSAVIVPAAQPRTKPKACNYGLIHARGDYIVIYDAEDLPEPDQLKRVYLAYKKVPPNVSCIQAKLNYYNRSQNLLTEWFTAEYSMWFDLFLPGLDASHAPIPLGGTSNHLKRDALVEAGAWDPYNVTEDADLGVRLHKRGYRTAIVNSTTFEEANSMLNNWIRQRSRWIKGYVITWLVHMRQPIKMIKEIGIKSFVSFQLVVAGTFFAALLNPIYWLLTTLWFLTKWNFIQQIFPTSIYYFGIICLFLGNFAFTYINVIGALERKYYDAVKYALLSPLYWGLMSIAAWKGFFQLLTKPHFWEKTQHGLARTKLKIPKTEIPNQPS